MAFYTAEITEVNGETSASLFKWESMDEARKRLHTQLSYYIGLDTCERVAVAILSDNLTMCRQEEWARPEEPELPVEPVELEETEE